MKRPPMTVSGKQVNEMDSVHLHGQMAAILLEFGKMINDFKVKCVL